MSRSRRKGLPLCNYSFLRKQPSEDAWTVSSPSGLDSSVEDPSFADGMVCSTCHLSVHLGAAPHTCSSPPDLLFWGRLREQCPSPGRKHRVVDGFGPTCPCLRMQGLETMSQASKGRDRGRGQRMAMDGQRERTEDGDEGRGGETQQWSLVPVNPLLHRVKIE